jgi:PAS domain S-box-containing protein
MEASGISSSRRSALARYGFALLTLLLALFLSLLLAPIIGGAPFLFFFAAVALTAHYGGWKPMLLVAIGAVFSVDYFMLSPAFSFEVTTTGIVQLTVFLLVAGLIGWLAEQRSHAARTAREQGEQFRVTLASIGDAVIATDTGGRIVFMNTVAEALTGWSASEAAGKPSAEVFRIVNASTRAAVENPVELVLRVGRVVGLANHTLLIARDGSERPIDDSGAPVRASDGSLRGVVLVFRDVSEREQAAAAIRATRDQLDVILRGVADGITAQDASGRLIYANDAAARASGFASVEAMRATPPTRILEEFELLDESGQPFPLDRLPGRLALHGAASPEALIRFRRRANGEERWALVKATAVHEPNGQGALAISIIQDVTARRQAEEAQARLLASEQAARLDAEQARAQTRQILESITDGFLAFDRAWNFTYLNQTGARALGRSAEELLGKQLWAEFPELAGTPFGQLYRRAMDEGLALELEDYYPPFAAWFEARAYPSEHGLSLVFRDVSARRATEQALRASEDRTARLQNVTAALVGALTPQEIAEAVLREGLAAVNAAAGSIALLTPEGDALEILHAVGYPAELVERYRRLSLLDPSPEADTLRGGEPIFLESQRAAAQRWPHLAPLHPQLPWHAWANLPLFVGASAIGNLGLAFEEEQLFDDEIRSFLLTIAQQCSQALERARLYEAEQQSRARAELSQRRVSFLADVTIRLSASLEYTTRMQELARLVVPALADFCVVYVQQADGWIKRMAIAHVDPAREAELQALQEQDRIDPEGPNPVAQVFRSGEAEIATRLPAGRIAALVQGPEQQRASTQLQPHAFMIFPLVARSQIIGAMSFVLTDPARAFGDEDVTFAAEVARRAALALDNARLYSAAQDAIQLRDQFLSVAAHELRTPLTSLLGNAQLLQRRAGRESLFDARERRNVDVIVSQAQRLNAMVFALLDVSRLEAGQLAIAHDLLDLGALIRRILEELAPGLEGRSLELRCPDEPVQVLGDALRLEQVFQNLVQNAVKYSAPAMPVAVEIAREAEHVAVAVRDQGVGIPKEAIPQLFQRFFRASNVRGSNVAGMGIGLYVVREIVTLHGGTVEVASSEGQGSTFTVRLPLA